MKKHLFVVGLIMFGIYFSHSSNAQTNSFDFTAQYNLLDVDFTNDSLYQTLCLVHIMDQNITPDSIQVDQISSTDSTTVLKSQTFSFSEGPHVLIHPSGNKARIHFGDLQKGEYFFDVKIYGSSGSQYGPIRKRYHVN